MANKSTRGQMLILVVLIMIVALTVGLSLASRSFVNLRLSKQNEESQRAFQAAEAGVEQILQSSNSPDNFASGASDQLGNNASYASVVTYPSGSVFHLNGGELVDQDVGMDVWLSNYPDYTNPTSGRVTFYWGTGNQNTCIQGTAPSPNVRSALEIVMLTYDNGASKLLPRLTKFFYDGCGGRVTNSVAPASAAGEPILNVAYQYKATVSFTNGLILKAVPVFNSSKMSVVADVGAPTFTPLSLPKQGAQVQSTGRSGATSRKVQYFASYPQIPLEIFPYSILSQ